MSRAGRASLGALLVVSALLAQGPQIGAAQTQLATPAEAASGNEDFGNDQSAGGADLVADLEVLEEFVEDTDPSGYGGIWLSDGTIRIAFKTADAARDREIAELVATPERLRFERVARSEDELLAIKEQVIAAKSELASEGVTITGAGLDTSTNRVVIGVTDATPSTEAAVHKRFEPNSVVVSEIPFAVASSRDDYGPPWAGGMTLTGTCSGSSDCALANCSANFQTKQVINNLVFYFLLTAGHCFANGTAVLNGIGVPVGDVNGSWFYNYTDADVEKIRIAPVAADTRIITKYPATRVVTGSRGSQTVGETGICKSGITTDETCGWGNAYVHHDFYVCLDASCSVQIYMRDHVVAQRSSPGLNFGDSGGPVYRYDGTGGVTGYGIVSAQSSDRTFMFYSFLRNALAKTGGTLCVNNIC